MGRNQTTRAKLRAATGNAHARVDAVFSRFDLGSRDDYGRFLQAQAAALLPLERALDAGIAPHLDIGWAGRRRGAALLSDLAGLGLPAPTIEAMAPIARAEAGLGTIYVLEGSRLGGALLAGSVCPGLPASFLAPGDPRRWRALVAALDDLLLTDRQINGAIEAAERVFDLFERCAWAQFAEGVR